MIYLALKLDSFAGEAEDPNFLTHLLRELPGTNQYSDINIVSLNKVCGMPYK